MSTKIRTLDELEARLTEDLKWRKHEIEMWERLADRAREHELSGLLRGGTALLYAHWEGYVKTAGAAYLEYVSRKGMNIGDLRDEMAAVALRSHIQTLAEAKKPEFHTQIVRLARSKDEPARLPFDSATIKTHANLNFETFWSIMHSLGCDAEPHRIYESTIDKRLLKARNEIAHGREEYVQLQDWRDIRSRIEKILDDVRTQISNAAAMKTYTATSAPRL